MGPQMDERESFSDLVYEQQTQLAERELYSHQTTHPVESAKQLSRKTNTKV